MCVARTGKTVRYWNVQEVNEDLSRTEWLLSSGTYDAGEDMFHFSTTFRAITTRNY